MTELFPGDAAQAIAGLLPLGVMILLIASAIVLLRSLAGKSISDRSTRYRVRKLVSYGGTVVILLLVLGAFSERVAQVSLIIGAIGAGVAFSLQEVIASIAGWVALSFGSFYKPGDRVELGGIKGDVIDIGILRTTLMEVGEWVAGDLYSGRIVRIANSHVFKEPVFNYSSEFHFLWDEFTIPVRYGSDWQEAQRIFEAATLEHVGNYARQSQAEWDKIVRHYLLEDAKLEPQVTLALNDNWIEFTVRFLTDYRSRRSVKDRIYRSILDAVDASNGRVKLASETLELVSPGKNG